jgi:cytoskeletal protein CcmA (bactofilin family)
MREVRGQIDGDLVVDEPTTLWGSVGGNVRVVNRAKLYVRGTVVGDLIVEDGGRVHIFGNVAGGLRVLAGAKVVHSGLVGGDVLNEGGRLYIEPAGRVNGKVKTTEEGKTEIAPRPTPLNDIEG